MSCSTGSSLLLYANVTFSNRTVPLRARETKGILRAEDLDRRVEHLEDAPRAGQALLNRIGNLRDVRNLPRELLQQAGEDDHARPQ